MKPDHIKGAIAIQHLENSVATELFVDSETGQTIFLEGRVPLPDGSTTAVAFSFELADLVAMAIAKGRIVDQY